MKLLVLPLILATGLAAGCGIEDDKVVVSQGCKNHGGVAGQTGAESYADQVLRDTYDATIILCKDGSVVRVGK